MMSDPRAIVSSEREARGDHAWPRRDGIAAGRGSSLRDRRVTIALDENHRLVLMTREID